MVIRIIGGTDLGYQDNRWNRSAAHKKNIVTIKNNVNKE